MILSNKKIKFSLVALVACSAMSSAHSFSSLSRACGMKDLRDQGFLNVALYTFNAIGMPDYLLSINMLDDDTLKQYWVLESFTIDLPTPFGDTRPKAYLYSESNIYISPAAVIGGGASNSGDYFKSYASGYSVTRYNDMMLNDRVNYAATNRHLMYFARSGSSEIVESVRNIRGGKFRVDGFHYSVDPITKQVGMVPPSVAFDCNFTGGLPSWPF